MISIFVWISICLLMFSIGYNIGCYNLIKEKNKYNIEFFRLKGELSKKDAIIWTLDDEVITLKKRLKEKFHDNEVDEI